VLEHTAISEPDEIFLPNVLVHARGVVLLIVLNGSVVQSISVCHSGRNWRWQGGLRKRQRGRIQEADRYLVRREWISDKAASIWIGARRIRVENGRRLIAEISRQIRWRRYAV